MSIEDIFDENGKLKLRVKLKETEGYKLDGAKPDLDLVLGDFSKALREVGKVGTYGLIKYPPSNWLKVEDAERRYSSAMLRHYFEHRDEDGTKIDPESNLLHLAHTAWNALAALELHLRSEK
jgi:hypothetical protein